MRQPIRIVGILISVEIQIRTLGGQFARHADSAVGSVAGIGIDNIGAVGLQDFLALNRNIRRHAQRDRKSFCRAQHCIGNASIAAGGVEQNFAGGKLAIATSFSNDAGGGAILH